jgi:hypothetical protein
VREDLIETITSRGYWRINFQPVGAPASLSLKACGDLVDKSAVRLRGWYYPFHGHGPAENYGIENHNKYCQGWVDSGEYKEFWRMYRSGQFLHYRGVQEDWMTPEVAGRFYDHDMESGKYLDFVGSLTMFLTEVMEFLTRLHRAGLYQLGVRVTLSLNNTKGRQLHSFDPGRYLAFARITQEDPILFERMYIADELQTPARDLAIEPIVHLFELFNMPDVSVDSVVKKDQDSLYSFKSGR